MTYIFISLIILGLLFLCFYSSCSLREAVEKRDTFGMNEAMNSSVKIHQKDAQGNTALSYAAWSGDLKMVYLLIEQGANINTKNYTGETPLILAARNGHTAIVNVLLNHGARIKQKSSKK